MVHFQIFLDPSLAMRILFFTAGTLIGCLAASLYMCANIGMGPYDAIPFIAEDLSHKKIPFKYARMTLDISATAIGFVCGSIVGIGTFKTSAAR